MVIFEGVELQLQEGDIITSKKGILVQSPVTKKWYTYFKAKYHGKGNVEILSEKVEQEGTRKVR